MSEPAHEYLSTSCFHGGHAYCQSTTGRSYAAPGSITEWVKKPASCKFCEASCICPCHARTDEDRVRDAMTEAQAHPGRTITR